MSPIDPDTIGRDARRAAIRDGKAARNHLAKALDRLDILTESSDGTTQQERTAVRDAIRSITEAIRTLNEDAATVTGMGPA